MSQDPTRQITRADVLGDPGVARLIEQAVREDLNAWGADVASGDVTARLVPGERDCRGRIVFREAGVVAGLPIAEQVLSLIAPDAGLDCLVQDGDRLEAGQTAAAISGPARQVLAAERLMLNFLQRLSGNATATRKFVDAIAGTGAKLLDTRKTTPGWRLLEKYAVRMGGGHNHRIGLYDQVLIKDNHLASLGGEASVPEAIQRARAGAPAGTPLEIEVTTQDGALTAARAGADIVLLDNFTVEGLRAAVAAVRADAGERGAAPPLLEASGGVTLDSVRAIAETRVDRISTGWITHSAGSVDIALDFEISEAE